MSIIEMIKRTPESRKELEDAKKDSRTIVFVSAGVCLLAGIGFTAIPSGFIQALCAIVGILSFIAAIYFGSYRSKLKTLKHLNFVSFVCYNCGTYYDIENLREIEELKTSDGTVFHLIEISYKCEKCGYKETVKRVVPHDVPSIENPTMDHRVVYANKLEYHEMEEEIEKMKQKSSENGL